MCPETLSVTMSRGVFPTLYSRGYPEDEGYMSIDISPETQARLIAAAHAEGMSVDGLLGRLIDEP